MLPCAIRRRSASGVMSTSCTCSAARTTESGTVSRCGTPVIVSTTSLSDSRCWTLTVLSTSIPASSKRLDVLPALVVRSGPGDVGVRQLVDEHELRVTRAGWRRDPSPRTARRGRRRSCAGRSAGRAAVPRCAARPCVSTKPTTTSVPRSARRLPSSSMSKVLPTPGLRRGRCAGCRAPTHSQRTACSVASRRCRERRVSAP